MIDEVVRQYIEFRISIFLEVHQREIYYDILILLKVEGVEYCRCDKKLASVYGIRAHLIGSQLSHIAGLVSTALRAQAGAGAAGHSGGDLDRAT